MSRDTRANRASSTREEWMNMYFGYEDRIEQGKEQVKCKGMFVIFSPDDRILESNIGVD